MDIVSWYWRVVNTVKKLGSGAFASVDLYSHVIQVYNFDGNVQACGGVPAPPNLPIGASPNDIGKDITLRGAVSRVGFGHAFR